ncbi:MAG: hypothetical protein CMK29_01750 [Porticoccaceae bacterium]|jgi:hypothetical protein|nr:hypothetical protein [Porticoccaceae bacterium]OUW59128.1 MAG: hypothetical protein CBD57_01060 [Candidatus Pelagibacter sp. TMED197]|tara:strand:- start:20002 stop:20208 length:207 start_codon:yes stop_codon:yes gene_type:complete
MSKVKQYYTDIAETKVDKIVKSYTDNLITEQTAIKDIMDVENVNLLNIDDENVGEVLYYAKEDLKVMQ